MGFYLPFLCGICMSLLNELMEFSTGLSFFRLSSFVFSVPIECKLDG